ncbi:SET domain-containing protein-lysine N-methyltransferase, partial [Salmonella enterica subsp. salamae]|nr:SET domain-containing protein-lysine N-methyltransferase [Salmonella enterica subsp. salamae]
MRGIGAVIHFHSPTGSSVLSPDVSGMWNSIRDWFSLPAQDEAAQCFRIFYQPDEGTSSPDRLKCFLKLKALASPGRQANFTAERICGTGETICMIASGKNSDLPPVTLHLNDQEWPTAQPQESAPTTETRGGPGSKGIPITSAQMQTWLDLPPEAKRSAGGWRKWAQAQGVTLGSASLCLTNTGLTPNGRKRLLPPEERGSTIIQTQLLEWFNMSPEKRSEAGGWRAWALAKGISIRSAGTFLTNSGLTPFGIERLQPPEERAPPITNAQIRAWRDMSQKAKRESGGWIKWAQAQGIAIGSASGYLTNTGLKYNGMVRLQHATSASLLASASTGDEIAVSVGTPPESSGEKRSLSLTTEDISAPPAKQIKEEEDPVTWRTHQINNNLPILQHWRDPTISVMARAEGRIESLQVTRWGPLFNPIPRQTKARINQDIRWFLHNEGSHD